MAKNYQSKSETLKNAKSDAKTMSTVYPGKEYWIIESVDNANTKKFFVEGRGKQTTAITKTANL
jgi:hypothetical protein